jgi:RimJ/RimL family protein N-acetyltransferase
VSATARPGEDVVYGQVALRPLAKLSQDDWKVLYSFYRDREIAAWSSAKPIRIPLWLFRKMSLLEEASGDRFGFGIFLRETAQLIGGAELYDLGPAGASPPRFATLGIMIGRKELWSQHYGRAAVTALLLFAFVHLDPPLERVRLTTLQFNQRAQRAFLAAGFRVVGRDSPPRQPRLLMECTREEWNARHPPDPSSRAL